MSRDEAVSIVLDNGTGSCKVGFASDDDPKCTVPTVVGLDRASNATLIGSLALDGDHQHVNLTYPMEHGLVTDWDAMEKVYEHVFHNELHVEPAEHRVLLTEAALNPKTNREKMGQIMFETFGTPAIYVGVKAVLSMYAAGRTTGISFQSGEGLSQIVPIYDGFSLPGAVMRSDVGGRDVTKYLRKLLAENGDYSLNSTELDTVRQMKEKLCYVSEDYCSETNRDAETTSNQKTYELPDGKSVTVIKERFQAPEILFDPSIVDVKGSGVHELIYGSIIKCDLDLRKAMYGNVVLSGGNTMLPGFVARINKELTATAPPSMAIKLIASPQRMYSAWTGGSVLAQLHSFQKMWVDKKEYDEHGPAIVTKKCA